MWHAGQSAAMTRERNLALKPGLENAPPSLDKASGLPCPIVSAVNDLPLGDLGPWGRHFLVRATPDATLARGERRSGAINHAAGERAVRKDSCLPSWRACGGVF